MEDIQNRILLTTTEIVSAPDGQDRESLIKVSSSSHQHVTITEKKVTWFLASRKRGEWRKNKIAWSRSLTVLSLSHRIYLLLVKIHFPEFQQRRLGQVLWVKSVVSSNLSWTFLSPSFTMAQCHCQVIHLTPYRSRFEKNWSPQSLLLFVFSEKSSTGANILIRGISSEYTSATSHSSCISSLEMIGNLETSDSCGSSWFSSFLADSVDAVGIVRVLSLRRKKIVKKNSLKRTQKVGKSLECWSLAWRISFSSFKNREKLNSSIFGREKMRVLERRVAKFATLYSSSFIFLQFDWLLQTSLEIWLVVLCLV